MTTADSDLLLETMGMVMAAIHRQTVVPRSDYDKMAHAAYALYRENEQLRQKLADLEQLASSWSGNPGRHPVIAAARKMLQVRSRCLL